MPKRPNFLVIMTDQHRHDHLGCYGNSIVKTPNIDALAAAGTQLEQMYVANPICMPNRAAFMTGRMPSVNRSRHNGIGLDLEANTFVDVLRSVGYKTALIGKSHLQTVTPANPIYAAPEDNPDQTALDPALSGPYKNKRNLADPAFAQESPFSWQDADHEIPTPYYGFDYLRLCSGHGDTGSHHYARWFADACPDPDKQPGPDNALARSPHHPQAYHSAVPPEYHPTSYIARETMAYLADYAAADGDEPFFIQCSFPDPHHPFAVPGKYWDMYDPAEVELPRSFYESRHDAIPPLQALAEKSAVSTKPDFFTQPFVFQEDVIREVTARTYGMITFIDDAVGEILAQLEDLGVADNTVVCFVSDHGDWMGDHGLLLKDTFHYQSLIRVPFIWRDPEAQFNAGQLRGMGHFIDISRTILDRANVNAYAGHQGQSLLPLFAGNSEVGRERALIEHTTHVDYLVAPNSRIFTLIDETVDDERWRLTVWEGQPWGELYNLSTDPDELDNLWDVAAAAPIKSQLLLNMIHEMQGLNDNWPYPVWRA